PGGASWIAAEAYDESGAKLSEVHLSGPDPYDFSASFLAWAARTPVSGAGALGPVAAYGLPALTKGMTSAGLRRVSSTGQSPLSLRRAMEGRGPRAGPGRLRWQQ